MKRTLRNMKDKTRAKKIWIRILVTLAICALCAFGLYQAYLRLTDQSHLDETFYQVESDKLVSNMRIVFLTDLHLSTFGENNIELVTRVQALKPDLILIGGDMNIRNNDDYSVVISLCQQLVDITDVYYALGNHELSRILTNDWDIYNDVEATGVTMLNNIYVKVQVGDNVLYIGGVSQPKADIPMYSNGIIQSLAEADGFKLLLSHYPSNYDMIYPYDIDLVLAGHLHGGQINLPYFDGVFSPEDGLFPDYTEGEFTENGTTMIVGRGLGNSHDFPRINNPPEIVIIDLSSSSASYNTIRLLTQFDADTEESAQATVAPSQANEDGGNMLELMEQKEQDNRQLAEDALNTPEPTAVIVP